MIRPPTSRVHVSPIVWALKDRRMAVAALGLMMKASVETEELRERWVRYQFQGEYQASALRRQEGG